MTTLNDALTKREQAQKNAERLQAAPTFAAGRLIVSGPSTADLALQHIFPLDPAYSQVFSQESEFDVVFPVEFADEPHMSFGYALDPISNRKTGFAPSATAMVHQWATIDRQVTTHYLGATIVVKFDVIVDTVFLVHWTALETALVGTVPTGPNGLI